MRIVIVDDEQLARDRIRSLLLKTSDCHVVGVADNGATAIEAVRTLKPDLVFLDVSMPRGSGFDVIRAVGPERMPITVFVTAYDKHALRAFDHAALDYLLKPFDNERFARTLQRAREQCQLRHASEHAQRLNKALQLTEGGALGMPGAGATGTYLDRIAVDSRGHLRVVPVSDIDYISASGVYAELHVGEKTYLVRERMATLEERLDPTDFVRVHRSAIVRLTRIEVLLRRGGGDYALRLKGGETVPVSRGRVEQLEDRMRQRQS